MKPDSNISIVLFAVLLTGSAAGGQFELEIAFPDLSFQRPVDLQHAGDATERLFVVEQAGVIALFDRSDPEPAAGVFLDIRDRVNDGGEKGLLGLAFHPDFARNGFFYVNYTAASPLRTVIARYGISAADPDVADPDSESILLEFNQPFSNHNGGQLAFGADGYLYIATGDGGSGGDPQGNGQSLSTLLGKILRIDVNGGSEELSYAIPADNPFAGQEGVRPEIYALGMRNPWRISFDRSTGELWAGDVGQNSFEEVDLIRRGGNYGCNAVEGETCFNPRSDCAPDRFDAPVWVYGRDQGGSVTGGYVYRGRRVPELFGSYVYADWVSGRIWALRLDESGTANNVELLKTDLGISSFGFGVADELYICAFDGRIYRFVATAPTAVEAGSDVPFRFALGQNVPNPFNGSTSVEYVLPAAATATLEVFNLSGQRVRTLSQGLLSAGIHRVSWDGRDGRGHPVATGVYLYRLATPRRIESRKLILLR